MMYRFVALALLLVSLVGCDQASKHYAVTHWKNQPPQSYFGDVFRIHYAENPGAFLSLAAGLPREARFWLLTVMNALVLAGVGWFLLFRRDLDRMAFAALGLILAGGIGNLIDRVRLDGIVIDFLNLGIGGVRTGIFNVADIAITAGFLLLIPKMFASESIDTPQQPAAQSS
ncbi:lipoprotein signal peptidase [Maioricimonas rarisocia]|uniref:Lipoprotein signal peptidase n=1 Tax=Maioricimonas rarisocia TaxID=2528026 RepID=A0A517Z5Y9_9PLAN|nr:signal peptidase II [Maioricimonas rarisocia]QDU37918.1 lipoprotein signal peptidase [Maioricimonas rarisocia]